MARLKRHIPTSVLGAVLVHVVALLMLVVGFQMSNKPRSITQPEIATVKAKVIDGRELDRKKEQKRLAEERKRQQALEQQRRREEKKRTELKKKEQQQKRRVEEKKRAEQAKRKQELERAKRQARLKEQKKRKRKEEEKRRAEEIKQQAELKKKQQERQRREAEQKAEQQRLAAIMAEETAAINAAEERRQRAALDRKLRALTDQYVAAIAAKIQRLWRKPASARSGGSCSVYVKQAPGGFIQEVKVQQCSGDESFRRSVEGAVWKADPLPPPPDPQVFDRELHFRFEPNN